MSAKRLAKLRSLLAAEVERRMNKAMKLRSEKLKQMSLESYLIEQRVFCESPGCIDLAKVCRDIDGEKTVLCWQHDPETIQSFAEWLASTDDAIGDATDFNEWLHNRGDNI